MTRSPAQSLHIEETANDRWKRDAQAWLPRGIIAAVALHFALFAFWPGLSVADLNGTGRDEFIVMPPQLDVPQPPERIERPALPVVGSDAIADDITIPPNTFDVWQPERLAPPAAAPGASARDEFVQFVPTMVPPRLVNEAEVVRALVQHYPRTLRDAGVGGQVDVLVWLDGDGSVVRAAVGRSSGHTALDEAALRVVDMMRLTPALSMGAPVRVIVSIPVVFQAPRD